MNDIAAGAVAGGVTLFIIILAVFFYCFFDILIGVAAKKRGRSGFLWFLFSFFTTPIIAGLFLLLFGDNR